MRLLIGLIILIQMSLSQVKWSIDKTHSNVGFTVTHMMVSEVYGEFKEYSAEITSNGNDFTDAKISLSIDVASINTANEKRDGHLRTSDFFDAEKFSKITFTAKSMKKTRDNEFELVGDFQMKDVKKEITLQVKQIGILDAGDKSRAGFKISGEINRQDFNVKWNRLMENTMGSVVSDKVSIEIRLELVRAK